MARRKNTSEEESGATAVLDAPIADESGASAPVTSAKTSRLIKYWSPENESLIIGSNPPVEFIDHLVVIDADRSPLTKKALESSNAFKSSFFIVEDRTGDDDFKIAFGKRLRNLVGNDRSDMVSMERGWLSICALFTKDELVKFGISRSQPDIEKLIYLAINNKYVEGIV